MREQLATEIADLEAQEVNMANEVERVAQTEPFDSHQYSSFKGELDTVQAKLAAKRDELQNIYGAVETAQAELFSQFDNIQIGEVTMTLREMCTTEKHYQLLSGWIQNYVGDLAQTHAAVETSYKSQVVALEETVVDLEGYRKQALENADKLADMEMRRDAAAVELLNSQEETKRLASDNESLRKQLEAKAQPYQTNSSVDLQELAQQIQAAKPAIYNKRWKSELNRTHYHAELASTGETLEIHYFEIGKYREVTSDEAERFRNEQAAQAAIEAERLAQEAIRDQPLVVAPPFPIPEVPGNTADGEVAQEAAGQVTRGEFEQLAARVSLLEQSAVRVA